LTGGALAPSAIGEKQKSPGQSGLFAFFLPCGGSYLLTPSFSSPER